MRGGSITSCKAGGNEATIDSRSLGIVITTNEIVGASEFLLSTGADFELTQPITPPAELIMNEENILASLWLKVASSGDTNFCKAKRN
jgi:hypothetical protein